MPIAPVMRWWRAGWATTDPPRLRPTPIKVGAVKPPDADPQPVAEPARVPAPPETGNPVVDDAMARVADLSGVPVDEHHDRLQAAHEVLSDVLAKARDHVQGTIPGVPGPRG